MTRIYDLHCHSNFSDGILSPEELVSRAKSKEVAVLALTDHDTMAGYHRASVQAKHENIDLIPGIEFSSQWNGRGIHIVGLNIDPLCEPILKAVESQERARRVRAEKIADKLEAMGVDGALQGARDYAGEGVIGRPHFARHLVEHGYVANMNQAFKKYLGAGKPGDIKQEWPEIEEVVAWINAGGGISVLAHPAKYSMTRTKLCCLVEHFKTCGGQAIEIISGSQTDAETRDLAKIAAKYELLGSCGSDFHTPNCQWQELGVFGTMPAQIPPVWTLWET